MRDEAYLDKEMQKSNLLAAYHALDERLSNTPHLQEVTEITQDICSDLRKAMAGKISEALIDEASYAASRIMELASFIYGLGRNAKLLAIVDIKHYLDTQYVISLLKKGLTDEIVAGK